MRFYAATVGKKLAKELGLETMGLDVLAALLERVMAAGLDELNTSALHRFTAGVGGLGGSAEPATMCGWGGPSDDAIGV